MWSVPRRRSESSTSRTIQRRLLPERFGPSPIAPWNFVASTTSSRRPASALPTIVSDSPREYTSAVSMKLMPASSARWMIATLSSWSRLPIAPNIIAPRHSSLTFDPGVPQRPVAHRGRQYGRRTTARSAGTPRSGRPPMPEQDRFALDVIRPWPDVAREAAYQVLLVHGAPDQLDDRTAALGRARPVEARRRVRRRRRRRPRRRRRVGHRRHDPRRRRAARSTRSPPSGTSTSKHDGELAVRGPDLKINALTLNVVHTMVHEGLRRRTGSRAPRSAAGRAARRAARPTTSTSCTSPPTLRTASHRRSPPTDRPTRWRPSVAMS